MVLAVAVTLVISSAFAGGDGARQRYGPWVQNQEKGYFFRTFEYKVNANDKEYKHEYCIFFKNNKVVDNTWVYFFNPETKKFWARYPTVNHPQYAVQAKKGAEVWSVVPPANRYVETNLTKINLKQYFPPVKENFCPYVPNTTDKTLLVSPPPDLP